MYRIYVNKMSLSPWNVLITG